MIANNTQGPVFEFKIPPASMKHWLAYVNILDKSGIPACSVVTRITFSPDEVNTLRFEPAGMAQTGVLPYITLEQMEDVLSVAGTDEVSVCIGTKDKPIDPTRQIAAPVKVVAPVAVAPLPALPPMTAPGHLMGAPTMPIPLQQFVPVQPAAAPAAEAPKPARAARKPRATADGAGSTASTTNTTAANACVPAKHADEPGAFTTSNQRRHCYGTDESACG